MAVCLLLPMLFATAATSAVQDTVGLLRKFVGPLDTVSAICQHFLSSSQSTFCSWQPWLVWQAMAAHHSQFVWCNDFLQPLAEQHESCSLPTSCQLHLLQVSQAVHRVFKIHFCEHPFHISS